MDPRNEPASYVDVHVGTDARFGPGATPYNWQYEGHGTTEESCVLQSFGGCFAEAPYSWFYAESYMFWDAPRGVVDERAGVGVAYRLVQRCEGQSVSRPMWANFTYSTEADADNGINTWNAGGSIAIWGNAVNGRGGLLGETRDPVTGGDAPGYNVLFEEHANPNPTNANTGIPDGERERSIRVDAPSLGEHAALLYVHAHSEKTGVSGLAISSFSGYLQELTLDFNDPDAPAAWINVTRPDGSAVSPAAIAGGYKWYREDLRTSYDADDVVSCPKEVVIDDTGQTHAFGYAKTPAYVNKTADGKWSLTGQFSDHAGNVAWALEKVGIDRAAPAVSGTPNPAQPDGANGWYRSPAGVTFTLSCTDATSGCAGGSYDFSGLNGGAVSGFPATTNAAPEGVTTLACRASDVSGLSATGCGDVVRYDRSPPVPVAECSPSRGGTVWCSSSPWLRDPATVSVRCADNGGSNAANGNRCWHLNYTVDGGAEVALGSVANAAIPVTGEGAHTVAVTLTDHAGNVATAAYNLSIDAGPPTQPVVTLENDDADHVINVTPRWSWTASDSLSGVQEYRVYFNNGSGYTTTSNFTVTHSEGTQCMRVAAVDKAGNEGPQSDMSCVFVDHSAPTAIVKAPERFWVYKDGTPWFYASNQINQAMVLGDVRVTTYGYDAPNKPSSGLSWHKTLLNGADWTPVEGSNACTPPGTWCNHTYALSAGRGWKSFNVRIADAAGNVKTSPDPIRTAVTDHVAFSSASPFGTTSVPYAESHWKAPAGLSRVEVHRFNVAGFTPSPATRQASLAPTETSWRDTLVAPETSYHYKVLGYATVGGVDTLVWTSVEYPVRTVETGASTGWRVVQNLPSDFS